MSDREQDAWFVSVTYKNALGKEVFARRGILDLPHPMTAFDAAGAALEVEIRDAVGPACIPDVTREIHVVVWGKRDKGRAEGRCQQCGGLAVYDAERDAFMRPTPWHKEGSSVEVKPAADGVVFRPLDWK